MNSVGRRLLFGGAFRAISQVLIVVVGFVLVPVMVQHLGPEMFGAWAVIGGFLGYFTLLDLGLSSAVIRFVSRSHGANDPQGADEYICSAFWLFAVLSCVALVITLVIVVSCSWIWDDPVEIHRYRVAFGLAGITFSLTMVSRCFVGTLMAHVRHDLLALVESIVRILVAIGMYVALIYGGKLISVVAVHATGNLVKSVVFYALAQRVHGRLLLRWAHISRDKTREMFKYSVFSFSAQVSNLLRFQSGSLMIAFVHTMKAVEPFAIAERIFYLPSQFVIALCGAATPVLSSKEGSGDSEGLRRAFFIIHRYACGLAVFFTAMGMVCCGPFLKCWIGNHSSVTLITWLIQVGFIGTFFESLQVATLTLLFGVSKNRQYATINMIQGVLLVGVGIPMLYWFDLKGLLVLYVVLNCIFKMIAVSWIAARTLEVTLLHYYRKTCEYLLLPGIFVPLLYIGGRVMLQQATYGSLVLFGILGSTAFSLFFLLVLPRDLRSSLLNAVGRIAVKNRA